MAVVSGIGGRLAKDGTDVPNVQNWSIDFKAAIAAYGTTTTRGAKSRAAGPLDWSGKCTIPGHTPVVKPGDTFTFTGVISGTSPTQNIATGAAIVSQVDITCDIESGGQIMMAISFEGNGALSFAANGAITADTSFVDAYPSKGLMFKAAAPAGSPTYADVGDVRKWTLTLKCDVQQYGSSTAAGVVKRVAGPIDATLSFDVYNEDFRGASFVSQPNSPLCYKLYVDGSTFWEVQYMMVAGISGIEIDRDSGKIVGASVACELAAIATYSAAAHGGFIAKPGGTKLWDWTT